MMTKIKAPYVMTMFMAVTAMLLMPTYVAAEPKEADDEGAAVTQKAKQPPAPLKGKQVRIDTPKQRDITPKQRDITTPKQRDITTPKQVARVTPKARARYERTYDEGRARIIGSTTAASFYTGLTLLKAAEVQDLRLSASTLLSTTGLGLLSSYHATKDRRITVAMADAYDLGLFLGLANGMLLKPTATTVYEAGDGKGEVERELAPNAQLSQGLVIGSMVLGGAASLALASELKPTRGQVAFTSLAAQLGMASAWLSLKATQPEPSSEATRAALASGLDMGAMIGLATAPRIKWSLARTRLVGLGSFLGALGGWSLVALSSGGELDQAGFGSSAAPYYALGTLTGMWAGFGLSAYITQDMAPDRRFRARKAVKKTILAPTPVKGGVGLSISGMF